MAQDFLLGSETYRGRSIRLQLRRHAICNELENYQTEKGLVPRVAAALVEKYGIPASDFIIGADIRIYMNAWQFLQASEESKDAFIKKLDTFNSRFESGDLFGAWCLYTDAIFSIDDIDLATVEESSNQLDEQLAKKLRRVPNIEPAPIPVEAPGVTVEATSPPMAEVKPIAPREILDKLDDIRSAFAELDVQNQQLEHALVESEMARERLEEENEALRLRMEDMRERLRDVQLMTLEQLALETGSGRIYKVVQEEQQKIVRETDQEKRLPRRVEWSDRVMAVQYQKSFLKRFRDNFTLQEQNTITSSIRLLISSPQAPWDIGSFQTKKYNKLLKDVPPDAFFSYATGAIRVAWDVEGDNIYLYTIFRRGDRDYIDAES